MHVAHYTHILETVKERAREVVLCAHGQRGMATISTEVVLDLSKAIHDADRMKPKVGLEPTTPALRERCSAN